MATHPEQQRTLDRRGGGAAWPIAGLAIVAAILLAWRPWVRPVVEASPPPIHARLSLGTDLEFGAGVPFALSRDGRTVAFVGRDGDSQHLRLRRLDRPTSIPLAGTRGARRPFFSPDGEWIGFFAGDRLKKISTGGGAALTICDAPGGRGGTWGPDGTVVFSTAASPLLRVSADGGDPEPLTALAPGEHSHRWPSFLPDGSGLVFTNRSAPDSYSEATIERLDLASGRRTVLHRGGSMGRYVPPGKVVFLHDGAVFALPYDLEANEPTGSPVPLLDDVTFSEAEGDGYLATSHVGTVVYRRGERRPAEHRLVELSLTGEITPLRPELDSYDSPSYSPDGSRIAYTAGRGLDGDVWVLDTTRNEARRLTVGGTRDGTPVWAPDGNRIVFSSDRIGGTSNLYVVPVDGSGEAVQLTDLDLFAFATSFSPDGRILMATVFGSGRSGDIISVSMHDLRDVRGFAMSEFNEWNARISPDGRWLAYRSDESGRNEYYVQSLSDGDDRIRISDGGATGAAFWAPDGETVYYRSREGLMAVALARDGATLRPGTPRQLFLLPTGLELGDIAPDGTRFVGTDPATDGSVAVERDQLRLIVHAFGE